MFVGYPPYMNYLIKFFILSLTFFSILSCNSIQDKARNTINKTGEIAGSGTAEFVKGIKEGIDKTLQCKVETDQRLSNKGVRTGKFYISHDTNGTSNVLTVYVIFDRDYKDHLTATVFDRNNQEYGRATLNLEKHAGEASFLDFIFDKRTEIESKSLFTIK